MRTPMLLALLACAPCRAAAQAAFPAELPGVSIGHGLPPTFEASGAVWHPLEQRLYVIGDGGTLARMEADGSFVSPWPIGGDLEAVTIADPTQPYVYVGREHPDAVLEYDVQAAQITRTFDLTPWMTGAINLGLEGLTFVPDAADPEGGLFVAAHQGNGTLHVFRLPIRSSASSTAVQPVATYVPAPGRTDLAEITYRSDDGFLYALWDTDDRISRLSTSGVLLEEWSVPGQSTEGLALRGCEVFVCDDVGPIVTRYGGFKSAGECELFSAATSQLSIGSGGTLQAALRAAHGAQPGDLYLVLGSTSGTSPALPVDGLLLPLVPDAWFSFLLANPNAPPWNGSLGVFPPSGKAGAALVLAPAAAAGLVGLQLDHAALALRLAPAVMVVAVSAAQHLTLVP